VRVADLDLRELLAFEPKGGVMTFGGQRVLLFDAVALGLLRKELIETLGIFAARGILTRLGYAHGWRTAESLRSAFPWESEQEWQRAGAQLQMLQGLQIVEHPERIWTDGRVWHESYEAEQHLLALGQAEGPVCWTLTGFASGYLSFAYGRKVYCVEDRCRGKGDAFCHVLGRFREEWGPEIEPHLLFYKTERVDAALKNVTIALRSAEKRLRARTKELANLVGNTEVVSGLVARSPAMKRTLDLARRVAKVESTVLVTGESGSGKERIARLIHDESARAHKAFVAVNCGAVAETLLESELFGHSKGAFTGADKDRPGLFEAAAYGTLFLDEVGEIPLNMQVKLLRVLQEKEVRRVGENRSRPVDVRVIAATNRSLADEVAAGHFREDLYYRLRVIELRVPPLRERVEDILPLARVFLSDAAGRMRQKVVGFTSRVADRLMGQEWRGNVRELQNAVEHAVALCQTSRVDVDDLPEELRTAPPKAAVTGQIRALEDIEREYILSAVDASGGNKTRAAASLKIGLATLHRKLKQYERK